MTKVITGPSSGSGYYGSNDLPARQSKIFTIKVIDPNKDDESSLVFQSASSASRAVELVKEEHPGWKCLVIDSHEPKPWRRDGRY